MKFIKRIVCLLLAVSMALTLCACGGSAKHEKQIFAMDTIMTLTAYGDHAETGLTDASGIINALAVMLDPESEDSTVYAMNHANGGNTVVKGQIVEMLQTAQLINARTNGAMDPAIYPLVKLWGFIDGRYTVPSEDEIDELLPTLGFNGVNVTSFTEAGSYLVSIPAGMELSFAALAKGCASDYAIAAMRADGVQSAVVSLGGNVQTLGQKPDGSSWNIAVQDPNDTGSYIGILSVGETAVVTSGGYQRYFDADGIRYHHILDPATGYPADSGLTSVTIVCEDGIMADALSTTLYILGLDKALAYWRNYGGFEAVMVTTDGRVVVTNGLYEIFTPSGDKYTYEYAN